MDTSCPNTVNNSKIADISKVKLSSLEYRNFLIGGHLLVMREVKIPHFYFIAILFYLSRSLARQDSYAEEQQRRRCASH